MSPPRDIFVSHLLKEPLVILTQLPATLPLAGKPQFWVPSVSSMLSTWWGLPLPKMTMREGDRSQVPPASSVISPCHHPCTHLEDMGPPYVCKVFHINSLQIWGCFQPFG